LWLQVQGDLAQASTALSDKTQAASALEVELEQLRCELSLKQGEGNQPSASGAAAAHHSAAVQQQLRPQQQQAEAELPKQQAEAEVQKQQRSDGEAQDQLSSIATTHPGQVSYSACLLLY